jgi:ribonuclease D
MPARFGPARLSTMIESPEHLASLVDSIRASGRVALDTEFVWERTYFPRLGIVQAGLCDGECALIDACAGFPLIALGPVLADTSIQKVLHDAQQDLTILRRASGESPRNIFDTRTAAGFAGFAATVSLQDLMASLLGIELPKTETRTDWLRRPLTEKQVEYALDDVRYLFRARDALLQRARDMGNEAWLLEEM